MTGPDNFLQRWSKRKLGKAESEPVARAETSSDAPEAISEIGPEADPVRANTAVTEPQEQILDLANLPPLESIAADTDVTAFLRPGVPVELTRAALRRAWSADPAIRDFVGLVENGWDFNDPQAIGGFGSIDPAEVARLAGQVIDKWPGATGASALDARGGETGDATPQVGGDSVKSAEKIGGDRTAHVQRSTNDTIRDNAFGAASPIKPA